jgi:hypothetical protein
MIRNEFPPEYHFSGALEVGSGGRDRYLRAMPDIAANPIAVPKQRKPDWIRVKAPPAQALPRPRS